MKKESSKQTKQTIVNLVHKQTTLNIDVTNAILETVLTQTASIMYTRQATYYYLLILNGWTRTNLHKAIKQRAESLSLPYNKGVLVKESLIADYAISNLNKLFTSVKISKKNPESVINKIADIMQKNKIAYNYLKDKLVKNPKESTDKQESQESTDKQESSKQDSTLTLDSVIEFIKSTSQESRLRLADVLADAIKSYADNKQTKQVKKAA